MRESRGRRNGWKAVCWLGLWFALTAPPGCACRPPSPPAPRPAEGQDAVERLLRLMGKRLVLMHGVARWKWNAKRPIADPEREQALLDALARQGAAHHLEPAFVRAFFRAQVEAAKRIQEGDFKRWEAEKRGPFRDAPDLALSLRPRIDELSADLLAALAELRRRFGKEEAARRIKASAQSILVGDGITGAVRDTAIAPLTKAAP
jgi:chorismate mutase